jgi:hypothetical protein
LFLGDYRPQEHARIVGRDGSMSAAGVNTAEMSNGLDLLQEEIRKRLQSLLRTRLLRGFPINIPFTDVDEIITQVLPLLLLHRVSFDSFLLSSYRLKPFVFMKIIILKYNLF